MSKFEFDLVKLKQICDIDVREAIKHHSSYDEYFCALDKFVKESKYYLSAYTTDMILNIEDERKDFRADLKRIRNDLLSLGITYSAATLTELDYEAEHGDGESLTNWLGKFHTEMDKMAQNIALAQIFSQPAPEKKTVAVSIDKPLILATDDKPELLTAVVNMLEGRFRVMAATSGLAALKLIEKHSPELFLLDIEMPQMNGYELAERIRNHSQFEQTPIIFLTSKNTREDVVSAVQHGGNDYLVKPVNKDVLLSKLLQHLGRI